MSGNALLPQISQRSTRIFHITYHYFLTYACLHHFFSGKDKRKRKLLKNATAFLLMFLCSSHYFSPWLKAIQGWKIPPPNSHSFSKATRSIRFFFTLKPHSVVMILSSVEMTISLGVKTCGFDRSALDSTAQKTCFLNYGSSYDSSHP